jgi:hypothetical protein
MQNCAKTEGGGVVKKRVIWVPILLVLFSDCVAERPLQEGAVPEGVIDERSYRLGGIGAFAEVVSLGIKKLALSAPMTPEDMDGLIEDAERIVADNGAKCFREEDFLVTDLFPESVTNGMHVLVIYLDPVEDEYLALKAEKADLLEKGEYEGEARGEIARKMGRLLSYPEERIEAMLAERTM